MTAALPNRDSDLDNGVIAHEYGHGISNRLTGTGPGCLGNQEQMGEGWSDWMTLYLHAAPGDTATTDRSVGGYVSFEPANEPGYIGIRTVPYTTDLVANPLTYGTRHRARSADGPARRRLRSGRDALGGLLEPRRPRGLRSGPLQRRPAATTSPTSS